MSQKQKNVKIAPAKKMYISCVLSSESVVHGNSTNMCSPALLYPPNDIPTQPQRIRSVQQSFLSSFQNSTLVHEIIQHCTSLSDKVVQTSVRVLNEGMLS